jgi:hypothetical protein
VILGQEPLEVKASTGKDTAEVPVTVLNSGKEKTTVTATVQAPALISVGPPPTELGPGQAKTLIVKITKGLNHHTKASYAWLVASNGSEQATRSVKIEPAPDPLIDWPVVIVLVTLGFAAFVMIVVAAGVWVNSSDGRLTGPVPGPKWSFESWASHLTAVGGLLGSVVVLAAITAVSEQIEKVSLVELNLLFLGLATVAPFVFQAFRRRDLDAYEREEEPGWGITWVLLIACWLVLGATLGELTTLGLTAWIITNGGVGGVALELGLAILVCLAIYYVVATAYSLASINWQKVAKLAKEEAAAKPQDSRGVHLRKALVAKSSRASRHVAVGTETEAYRLTLRLP